MLPVPGEPNNTSAQDPVLQTPEAEIDLSKDFFKEFPSYENAAIREAYLRGEIPFVSISPQGLNDRVFWNRTLVNALEGESVNTQHAIEAHPYTFFLATKVLIENIQNNPKNVTVESNARENLKDKSGIFLEHRYVLTTEQDLTREVRRPAYIEYALELIKILQKQENPEKTIQKHILKLGEVSPGFAIMTATSISALSHFYDVSFDAVSVLDTTLHEYVKKNNRDDRNAVHEIITALGDQIYVKENQENANAILERYFGLKQPIKEPITVESKYRPRLIFEGSEKWYNRRLGRRKLNVREMERISNRMMTDIVTGYCDDDLPNMLLANNLTNPSNWGFMNLLRSQNTFPELR